MMRQRIKGAEDAKCDIRRGALLKRHSAGGLGKQGARPKVRASRRPSAGPEAAVPSTPTKASRWPTNQRRREVHRSVFPLSAEDQESEKAGGRPGPTLHSDIRAE